MNSMTSLRWSALTLSCMLLLAGCASNKLEANRTGKERSEAQPRPGSAEPTLPGRYLQVLEKGRVTVQLNTDGTETCQGLRQGMLNAAEKANPGKGAKEMAGNVRCADQAQELAYALKAQNLDYQFASQEGCEHYAIVKGLLPPRPAPGTKSPCVPQARK